MLVIGGHKHCFVQIWQHVCLKILIWPFVWKGNKKLRRTGESRVAWAPAIIVAQLCMQAKDQCCSHNCSISVPCTACTALCSWSWVCTEAMHFLHWSKKKQKTLSVLQGCDKTYAADNWCIIVSLWSPTSKPSVGLKKQQPKNTKNKLKQY